MYTCGPFLKLTVSSWWSGSVACLQSGGNNQRGRHWLYYTNSRCFCGIFLVSTSATLFKLIHLVQELLGTEFYFWLFERPVLCSWSVLGWEGGQSWEVQLCSKQVCLHHLSVLSSQIWSIFEDGDYNRLSREVVQCLVIHTVKTKPYPSVKSELLAFQLTCCLLH